MGSLKVTGLEDIVNVTAELRDSYRGMVKQGLYEGAKILADTLHDETGNIKTYNVPYFEQEVKELQASMGISRMKENNGTIEVNIGFTGYNSIKTKKHPNGQPNILVARSINSGASYMKKQPFVKTALKKSKDKAVNKTVKTIEKRIDEITKRG